MVSAVEAVALVAIGGTSYALAWWIWRSRLMGAAHCALALALGYWWNGLSDIFSTALGLLVALSMIAVVVGVARWRKGSPALVATDSKQMLVLESGPDAEDKPHPLHGVARAARAVGVDIQGGRR